MDAGEEVPGEELLVGAVVGPDGFEAEFVAVLEPGGDLFEGGVFEIGGKACGTGGVGGIGEEVAAGVGDPTKVATKVSTKSVSINNIYNSRWCGWIT